MQGPDQLLLQNQGESVALNLAGGGGNESDRRPSGVQSTESGHAGAGHGSARTVEDAYAHVSIGANRAATGIEQMGFMKAVGIERIARTRRGATNGTVLDSFLTEMTRKVPGQMKHLHRPAHTQPVKNFSKHHKLATS